MDIREVFKLMMRNEIAPALRELGFKGSGVDFSLPHPTLYRLLHFQINAGAQVDTLDFTVNLAIIDVSEYDEKWQPWMPKKPTAAAILPIGRVFRIGALIGGADKWWTVSTGEATESQAADVVRIIREYAVPELQRGSMRGPSLNRQPDNDS